MIKPKKSLGQNFLIDQNIIKKITNLVEIKNKNVLEIGPGTGNLTANIVKQNPKSLMLIEKDNKLSELLKINFNNFKSVRVINQDILKFDIEKFIKKNTIVFGNLPYNISTQILINFIKFSTWPPPYEKLIFMFQKEVAEKFLVKFNSSKYSRLSIISKWRLEVVDHFSISKNSFYPKPSVESILLVFKPIVNKKFKITKIQNLENITQSFFSSKRKMINKSFSKLFDNYEDVARKLDLDLSKRPSQLSADDYFKITELFEKKF